MTLAHLTRSAFIKAATSGAWSVHVDGIMMALQKERQEWMHQEEESERSWQQHELLMKKAKKTSE